MNVDIVNVEGKHVTLHGVTSWNTTNKEGSRIRLIYYEEDEGQEILQITKVVGSYLVDGV